MKNKITLVSLLFLIISSGLLGCSPVSFDSSSQKNDSSIVPSSNSSSDSSENSMPEANNLSELTSLIDWALFNFKDQMYIKINYLISDFDDEIQLINKRSELVSTPMSFGYNFNPRTSILFLVFFYSDYAEQSASATNILTQTTDYIYSIQSFVPQRPYNFDDFKINQISQTFEVTNTEQLWYAVEHDYRPIFTTDSVAKSIYLQAKSILRLIIDDTMTDYFKLIYIYDWMINNVEYDWTVLEHEGSYANYKAYFLEGVFNDGRAVCDGMAKAMVLMLGIEGIKCLRVTGDVIGSDGRHAWNYVFINGSWFYVDPTHGNMRCEEREVANHASFMQNAEYMTRSLIPTSFVDIFPTGSYDYFSSRRFTYKGDTLDLVASSVSDFNKITRAMMAGSFPNMSGEIKLDFDFGDDISDELFWSFFWVTSKNNYYHILRDDIYLSIVFY